MKIFTTILKEEIIPKTFVLSESQMFDLLLEAASLGDVYQKYYNQIPEEEFREIVAADPTAGEDKMGKYSKWLLALYTNEELKLEDLYKATEYLTTFHKYKNKLEKKDIGQYKSLGELYQAIEPYADNTQAASHKEEIRQIKSGAKKVYEDDEWLVIVPETKEAAIEYGKGTQWCTAATGSTNYFDYYNEQGPLYINIDKKTGQKLQFHFNSQQFMDETDRRFNRYNYNFTEGLYNFYRQQYGKDALLLRYDYVGCESDGLTYVQVNVGEGNHKCNFIDENEKPISDEWFDDAGYFNDNGLAIVYNDFKQNYLKRDGTLLLDKWYNRVTKFSDGYGIVILNGGLRNYVDINGNILCDTWFNEAKPFREGAAVVGVLNDDGYGIRYNAINAKGEYLFDKWFQKAGMCFNDGILLVMDNDKITYVKKDGEFLTDMLFDTGTRFSYGCAIVKKDGSYNVINKNGELLFDQWYYDIIYFGKGSGDEFDGFDCFFRLNNQQGVTLADRNGNIICDNWYDTIDSFKGGCAIVKKQGLWNVIGLDGKEICNEWLSYIYRDGDFMICHNQAGKRNFLSPYGGFAFEKWHDFIRIDRVYTNNSRTYELLGYDKDVSGGGPREVIHNADKFKFILRKTNEAKQRKTVTITESQYKQLLKDDNLTY